MAASGSTCGAISSTNSHADTDRLDALTTTVLTANPQVNLESWESIASIIKVCAQLTAQRHVTLRALACCFAEQCEGKPSKCETRAAKMHTYD